MKSLLLQDHFIHFETSGFKLLTSFFRKQRYRSYVILVDENTLTKCLPRLITAAPLLKEAAIIETESGETSKAIEVATNIWRTLSDLQADRSTLFINLGGGVLTDLGGFCASLYKRGIPFIHIPTTLLAMADASVGGKTAIDLDHLKNAVGNFSRPEAVFVDFDFLLTLPERQINNGLAEIYKMALIRDAKLWKNFNESAIEDLIFRSIQHKIQIVKKDPSDKDLRKILNFGHTLGHAVEGLSLAKGRDVLHGEAVVAGMIMEAHISFAKRLLSKNEYLEIVKRLTERFAFVSLEGITSEEIQHALVNDKKSSAGTLNFSLLEGIGACKWDQKVNWSLCEKAIIEYKRLSHG